MSIRHFRLHEICLDSIVDQPFVIGHDLLGRQRASAIIDWARFAWFQCYMF
jgi:hypothetical protein